MSYRNSYMAVADKRYIPEDRWNRFCDDAAKVAREIPGRMEIDRKREIIRVNGINFGETLGFPRDMTKAFPNSDYYIIHKSEADLRTASAIAAMFLLFRQDCLDENPTECKIFGDMISVQDGLKALRRAGVWKEGEKCLVAREDFNDIIDEAADRVKEEFTRIWHETIEKNGKPDGRLLQECIDNIVDEVMPDGLGEDDQIMFTDEIWKKAKLTMKSPAFYHVSVRKDGEVKDYWFLEQVDGIMFADKIRKEIGGVACFDLPDDHENAVAGKSFSLKDLPRSEAEAAPGLKM